MSSQDKETLVAFVEEAREHLAGIEDDLLAIEQGGVDIDNELVNRVFRAVHTIKGGAGFLELNKIKELAHAMENVMNRIRKNELVPTAEVITPLLDSADILGNMINAVGSEQEHDILDQLQALQGAMSSVTEARPRQEESTADRGRQDAVGISLATVMAVFDVTESELQAQIKDGNDIFVLEYDLFADLEQSGKTPLELVDELSSTGKILDSRIDIESMGDLEQDTSRLKLPLSVLFCTILDRELVLNYTGLDNDRVLSLFSAEEAERPPESFVPEPVEPEAEEMVAESRPTAKRMDKTPSPAARPTPTEKSVAGEGTLRVNVKTLDTLMSLAGELVLTRNQHLKTVASKDQPGLEMVSQRLNMVTAELQEAVMSTRMQPVGKVFSRFKRMVHDFARVHNKEINLLIEGEDVELDKSIIEAITDPLTHLVRNAVDHGIEGPEERVRTGKAPTGTLYLAASYEGGQVVIIVEDDGAGINVNKIKEKAQELGLFSRDQLALMTEQEIVKLIFLPGLSTASEVTDLSGRGVGMDVVHTNLSKTGGVVSIDSRQGKGTVISIKLPLTLAIVPCLVVAVENERYAIPQVNLREMVRIPAAQVKKRIERIGQALVMRLRGRLLPLISLREVLGIDRSTYEDIEKNRLHPDRRQIIEDRRGVVRDELGRLQEGSGEGRQDKRAESRDRRKSLTSAYHILVVSVGELQYGLLIDQLLDSEEVVVKPLGAHLRGCMVYAGAAVQGDGKVAMILDVAGISSTMKLTAMPEKISEEVLAAETKDKKDDSQTFLLVENSPREPLAVLMNLVSRIEKINIEQIEITGGRRNMQYMGGSLPLFGLDEAAKVSPLDESAGYCYVVVIRYGNRDAGILVGRVVDIEELIVSIDEQTHCQPGISGSAIIRDKITLLLDLRGLVATVMPEWTPAKESAAVQEEKLRVLVADDSSFFRKRIAGFIEEAGHHVFTAKDGLEALDILNEQQIDIVLTDIEMPNLDGLGLARRIRASDRLADIPIIAITSVTGEAAEARGLAAGINDYLIKLDREKIIEKIIEKIKAHIKS